MLLMIDNYDSFTYNLVQYLRVLHADVQVIRNDATSVAEIAGMRPEAIVISPGPCTPDQAGVSLEVVRELAGRLPILGICLGHQTIGQAFGGRVIRALEPMHGKVRPIRHSGEGVFHGLNNPLQVTRYHSLILERSSLPDCLAITAETEDGEIMGIRHKAFLLEGVQFHPEAILTSQGMELLDNFLKQAVAYAV